uniref:Luc7-like protein 3 n=1 Tax=Strigamia maritima TaxID=126957 RepID=T1J2U3_STRMM
MAAAAAAALLDELMGRDRNLAPTEKKREIRWEDPQVCKHYLVKFCPNELFVNTRADLGPCEKIHDEQLKSEYERSPGYQKMGYEEDFLRFCQGMMADVERRIRRGKQRLAQGNQEANAAKLAAPAPSGNNSEKITMLSERVNGLLEQVEKLGCEGKVEEAQGIMKLCDQLKDERESLRRCSENSHWLQQFPFQTAEIAAAQEKQMEVCEVCGAFLIVGDAQQRVDDHLMGKQHMGFAKIKATVDEILAKRQKEREEREQRREKEREEKRKVREEEEKVREKDREERRKKYEEDRKRDRERSKKRKKSRSKSRERKRSRSPSRNRKRSRSRSKDRRRSKDRSKRSRSKDKYSRNEHKKSRRSRSRSRSHGDGKMRHKHSKKEPQMADETIYSKSPIGPSVEITQNLSLPDTFNQFKEEKWDNINPQTAVIEAVYPIMESKPFEEESSTSSGGGTSGNNSGTKWQVSGWTEVKTRYNANGAKSEENETFCVNIKNSLQQISMKERDAKMGHVLNLNKKKFVKFVPMHMK